MSKRAGTSGPKTKRTQGLPRVSKRVSNTAKLRKKIEAKKKTNLDMIKRRVKGEHNTYAGKPNYSYANVDYPSRLRKKSDGR